MEIKEILDAGFEKWFVEHKEDLEHFMPELDEATLKTLFINSYSEGALVTSRYFGER